MKLLERDEYLAALETYLDGARSGSGRLVLLSGEAGLGKSALVDAFMQAHASDARVLIGWCDPLSTPRPLGPLLDMSAELGPELREHLAKESPRHQILAALMADLGGGDAPKIIVFEDVHWADEATLDLIRFLGRRISKTNALLIVTYRDDEVPPEHPLQTALGDLGTSQAPTRLVLVALSPRGVAEMAAGAKVDPMVLHAQTGGNPFFVSQVLSSDAQDVPDSVRELVLARMARLSPDAQSLLQAAAAAGPRVGGTMLGDIAPASHGALADCIGRGFLVKEGTHLVFRHELVRETILQATPTSRSRELHKRCLEHMISAEATGPDDLAMLAFHADEAGDEAAVLEFAPAAGHRASGLSAHREAVAQYARALHYASTLPSRERAMLLERHAYECYLADPIDDAIASRQEAISIWHALGDGLKEGENLRHLAQVLSFVDSPQALEAASAAVEILEQHPASSELALAYAAKAQIFQALERPEGLLWVNRALALAEQLGDEEVVVRSLTTRGALKFVAGDPSAVKDLLDSVSQAGPDMGLETARAYSNLIVLAIYRYDANAAIEHCREGLAYCIEHDLNTAELHMRAASSWALALLGSWPESREVAESVLKRGNLSPLTRLVILASQTFVAIRSDGEGVAALLAQGLEVASKVRPADEWNFHLAAAEWHWLEGDLDLAQAEAEAASGGLPAATSSWSQSSVGFWLWRVGLNPDVRGLERPFSLQVRGDWSGAADEWRKLGCRYHSAMALADSDDPEVLLRALGALDELGAHPGSTMVRSRLRALGARGIKKGHRRSTRQNPGNLTEREMEVAAFAGEGLQNGEIAQRLNVSPRTVEHHMTSILSKLGARNRVEASKLAGVHKEGISR